MRVRPVPTTVLRAIAILLSPYVHDVTEWKIVRALKEFDDAPPERPKGKPLPGQLLKVTEVAERFHVSRYTVDRMLRRGELRCVRVGGQNRVPESEVISMVEGCEK
jgi:excisionase family DNA binding protein